MPHGKRRLPIQTFAGVAASVCGTVGCVGGSHRAFVERWTEFFAGTDGSHLPEGTTAHRLRSAPGRSVGLEMIIPWTAQPSPDGTKPASWRIRLLVRLSPLTGFSHSGFFHVVVDTGALWTTFTDDFGRAAGITDITQGRATTVRWFGLDHQAWQHRIRMTVALDSSAQDTVTPEPVDVLFMK